jgi:dihydrofolate reductase
MKKIIGIACVDADGFYAKKDGGPLPWPHTEGDLDWFSYITKGNIIVLGSNSYKELMKLPPLKNREIWPVGKEYELKTVEDVLERFKEEESRDLFIGGGKGLWDGFIEYYNRFYLTVLNTVWVQDGLRFDDGDVFILENFDPIIDKPNYKVYDIVDEREYWG